MSDIEHQSAGSDMKERKTPYAVDVEQPSDEGQVVDISNTYIGVFGRLSRWLEKYGMESRGFQRVLPEERSKQSLWGLCLIWSSASLTISTFTVGYLGPAVFNLTFGQTTAIVWTILLIGACCSGYLATFGKKHGLRALVNSRFTFGYYGAMLMSALNILTEMIFGFQACIQGGQTLAAMSKGNLSTVGGIIIIGIVSWFIASAGFKYVHQYERVAWILPMIVYICLYTVGAPHFTGGTSPIVYSTPTQAGMALSFAAIAFSCGAGWVAVSADYYVYFPVETPSWKIFLISTLGIWAIPAFAITCGAGFAAALWSNVEWATAFAETDGSSAALVEIVLRPLGNVRYFFLFVLAFSMMSNNVFNLYSIGISMQLFGKGPSKLPRFVYTFLSVVVMIVVSCVGYKSLNDIIANLGAIIGYWSMAYFILIVEESVIFRRSRGYDLYGWDNPHILPVGFAAMLAFGVGIAGAVVGMSQTWYTGPIAKMIGEDGGDIGTWLAMSFAAVAYPGLRYFELKRFDR